MNVLIVGSGGREHALAWKAAQSPLADSVFVAPGNAGTARESNVHNIQIAADDIAGLIAFAQQEQIGLTIVGPEVPLVEGIVDQFQAAGLRCFGPTQRAAMMEGSKSFAKDFFFRYSIPTAQYRVFTDVEDAYHYIREQGAPLVIKADGLAAGKGVVIAQSEREAMDAVHSMLTDNSFGEAGSRVVIEQFLEGEEASFIVMCDGQHVLPMATSQDHKARDDGDQGPNTGGMGAYSPAPVVDEKIFQKVLDTVILPTMAGLAEEGTPYTGFLYAGLMIDKHGDAKVLEINCRFGDPETQPIMMRLQSDLVALCDAAIDGRLHEQQIVWDTRVALGVVLAAEGYPGEYRKGDRIEGLMHAEADVKIFHAGTQDKQGEVVTAGGRVLCVCALGVDVLSAQTKAYSIARKVQWPGRFMRSDIGYRAVSRPH